MLQLSRLNENNLIWLTLIWSLGKQLSIFCNFLLKRSAGALDSFIVAKLLMNHLPSSINAHTPHHHAIVWEGRQNCVHLWETWLRHDNKITMFLDKVPILPFFIHNYFSFWNFIENTNNCLHVTNTKALGPNNQTKKMSKSKVWWYILVINSVLKGS